MPRFGSLFRSSNPNRHRDRGDLARDAKQWANAAEAYSVYLHAIPNDGPIWVQLGNCLKEAGDYQASKEAYDRAREIIPDDADLQVQLGHLAKLDNRRDDAIAAFRRATELDPSRFDAWAELCELSHYEMPKTLVSPERDQELNRTEAARDPAPVARSATAINEFCSRLSTAAAQERGSEIPRIFHFVFGFKEKGDLPYYGAMAIRSALHFNPDWRAYYYTIHEPFGPNWNTVKDKVEVVCIEDFEFFGNARIRHYAHKADIIRLLILNHVGGAYLDIDTITQRSLEELRKNEYVMGVQAAGPESASGLCNAVMLGKPGARFSTRWLAHYDYFRSEGRDDLWDYHSVKLPVRLAALHPEDITVLDYRAFFYPLWPTIERTLFSDTGVIYDRELAPAYCFHLWNGATRSWLDKIDLEFVRCSGSLYARIARKVEGLEEFPVETEREGGMSPNCRPCDGGLPIRPRQSRQQVARVLPVSEASMADNAKYFVRLQT